MPSKIIHVDSFLIRQTLDDDFAILHGHSDHAGQFSPKWYIPKGQWWIDYRYVDEQQFLWSLAHTKLPKHIQTYAKERAYLKKTFCRRGAVPPLDRKKYRYKGIQIVHVDGAIVRQHLDPEFVLGGHEFVYPYIPKGEVWLDEKIDPLEIPYILEHEMVERSLMSKGEDYDAAHDCATAADKKLRRSHGAVYAGDAGSNTYTMTNRQFFTRFHR